MTTEIILAFALTATLCLFIGVELGRSMAHRDSSNLATTLGNTIAEVLKKLVPTRRMPKRKPKPKQE